MNLSAEAIAGEASITGRSTDPHRPRHLPLPCQVQPPQNHAEFNDKCKYEGVKGYFDEDGNYHNVKGQEDTDEKKKYDDVSSLDKTQKLSSDRLESCS